MRTPWASMKPGLEFQDRPRRVRAAADGSADAVGSGRLRGARRTEGGAQDQGRTQRSHLALLKMGGDVGGPRTREFYAGNRHGAQFPCVTGVRPAIVPRQPRVSDSLTAGTRPPRAAHRSADSACVLLSSCRHLFWIAAHWRREGARSSSTRTVRGLAAPTCRPSRHS